MTCIVGLIEDGKVYIGGDSAGVSNLDIRTRKDTKVFKRENFVFGYTTSFRMGQLLRFSLEMPEYRPEKKDLYEWMCTDFIEAVRSCLSQGGYMITDRGEEKAGVFMVGAHGRLFTVEGDLQVGEVCEDYSATGCGESYALGAMYAMDKGTAEERITKALDCASEFSAGVRGPYVIESV